MEFPTVVVNGASVHLHSGKQKSSFFTKLWGSTTKTVTFISSDDINSIIASVCSYALLRLPQRDSESLAIRLDLTASPCQWTIQTEPPNFAILYLLEKSKEIAKAMTHFIIERSLRKTPTSLLGFCSEGFLIGASSSALSEPDFLSSC